MNDNEFISAFAFDMTKQIEGVINDKIGDIHTRNRLLEGKVLQWYVLTQDQGFADFFGITTQREGVINPSQD